MCSKFGRTPDTAAPKVGDNKITHIFQDKRFDPRSKDYNAGLVGVLANSNGDKVLAAQAIQDAAQKAYNEGRLSQTGSSPDIVGGVVTVDTNAVAVEGRAFPNGQFSLGTIGTVTRDWP